ncbi:hypothetical protein, partial [Aquimarina sp. 2201CG5-10]|uniref:hypothetical protein n=1 Tax=Aquimarina callyspongiae TaxID=3098150 RepID=UPI002AB48C80
MIQNILKYISVALLFVSMAMQAQTQSTITLSTATSGNYTATESIILAPGFQSTSFSASIIAEPYFDPT